MGSARRGLYYIGRWYTGEYHEYTGGILSVLNIPQCAVHWGDILIISPSILNIAHYTGVFPGVLHRHYAGECARQYEVEETMQ